MKRYLRKCVQAAGMLSAFILACAALIALPIYLIIQGGALCITIAFAIWAIVLIGLTALGLGDENHHYIPPKVYRRR